MSIIKIFDNEEFGTIRVVIIDDEPWFVGKDVAFALLYKNTRKALQDHVDDEDKKYGVTIRDSIGRDQQPMLINESGFYSLVFSSTLPKAREFKRWVTSEVLPSIRKTATYSLDGNILDKSEPPVPVKDQIEYLIQLASITTEKPLRSDIIRKAVRLILG